MRTLTSFVVLAVIITAFLAGCAPVLPAARKNTATSMNITHGGVIQRPIVVDLEVSSTKVRGTPTGQSSEATLRNEAVQNALNSIGADVLVQPNFTVTLRGNTRTVEVVGFPASYRNFRPVAESDSIWLRHSSDISRLRLFDPTDSETTTPAPNTRTTRQLILE